MKLFRKNMPVIRFKGSPVSFDDFLEGLQDAVFRIPDLSTETEACGFASLSAPEDDSPLLKMEACFDGGWYCGVFRANTKTVATAVVNRLAAAEEKSRLLREGKSFLSRVEKRGIKEQVRHDLLSRTEPRVTLIPYFLNLDTGEGYFFSSSNKMYDMFEGSMERVCGATISRGGLSDEDKESLEDFLTYLWWDTEMNSFRTTAVGDRVVKTWFGDRVYVSDGENSMSAKGVVEEAKMAISRGSDVVKAEIQFKYIDDEFERRGVLTRELEFTSLQYPEAIFEAVDEDIEAFLFEFIKYTEDSFKVVDMWADIHGKAAENGSGISESVRKTWARGNFCTKLIEGMDI